MTELFAVCDSLSLRVALDNIEEEEDEEFVEDFVMPSSAGEGQPLKQEYAPVRVAHEV